MKNRLPPFTKAWICARITNGKRPLVSDWPFRCNRGCSLLFYTAGGGSIGCPRLGCLCRLAWCNLCSAPHLSHPNKDSPNSFLFHFSQYPRIAHPFFLLYVPHNNVSLPPKANQEATFTFITTFPLFFQSLHSLVPYKFPPCGESPAGTSRQRPLKNILFHLHNLLDT